jgi:taurine dioxygenase
VHPKAPNRHIFRLSNDRSVGINGVGPQWHNDGSFERAVFGHVGYHIIRVPENGGATSFAHQGAAFDALSPADQQRWERLVSVNSNSGVLHPMVHSHPISGRKSVYLHLGMTGAVIELDEAGKPSRLLEEEEMQDLFHQYNDLLNGGFSSSEPYSVAYEYTEGDMVVIDNLAVAHKAMPEAHADAKKQGLRILHRTTIKARQNFDPPAPLPPALNVYGPNPFGPKASGVWIGGGIGFRWDENIRMQN